MCGIWVKRLRREAVDENGCLHLAGDAILPKEIYVTVFEEGNGEAADWELVWG